MEKQQGPKGEPTPASLREAATPTQMSNLRASLEEMWTWGSFYRSQRERHCLTQTLSSTEWKRGCQFCCLRRPPPPHPLQCPPHLLRRHPLQRLHPSVGHPRTTTLRTSSGASRHGACVLLSVYSLQIPPEDGSAFSLKSRLAWVSSISIRKQMRTLQI